MKKIVILIPLLLTGCATMFAPSKDTVNINSTDKNTEILVDGQYVGTGNAHYEVQRGKSVTITAQKQGCAIGMVQTSKSIAGQTWINVLFWPGFIVDAATGAIQKTDPTTYTVNPNCYVKNTPSHSLS